MTLAFEKVPVWITIVEIRVALKMDACLGGEYGHGVRFLLEGHA